MLLIKPHATTCHFFLTDFSEAEIGSLEYCFPDTIVYLCDFHREQAWERWVKDRKHQLSAEDGKVLLDLLRTCAWAPSADEEDVPYNYYFQKAVETLKESKIWKSNEYVRQWLSNTWFSR